MDLLMKGLSGGSDNEEIPSDDEIDTPDVDERGHGRLLDAISSLDGKKRLVHTLRTVHGKNMSEFGFKSQKVDAQTLMTEMMGSLQKSSTHSDLKRQLKSAYKGAEVVDMPAAKHIKDRIQRSVGYEKAVKEVSKWEPVVTSNRKAPQLKFPLEQPTQKLINTHIKFRPVTSLEQEIDRELAKVRPENRIPKGKLFTPAEEEEMKAMSLDEAKERRAELMRMRALMYTKTSKLRWQNKIKSKRYRRAKKKERQKKMEKEMEELAVTDPQALLDKIEETETQRLEERGRLRHKRAGGKFAKQAKIFSKYDDEKRQQIQDMLAKHKELTKKQKQHLSSEEESEDEDNDLLATARPQAPTKNAWMQHTVVAPPTSSAAQLPARPQAPEAESSDDEDEKNRKFLATFDSSDSGGEEADKEGGGDKEEEDGDNDAGDWGDDDKEGDGDEENSNDKAGGSGSDSQEQPAQKETAALQHKPKVKAAEQGTPAEAKSKSRKKVQDQQQAGGSSSSVKTASGRAEKELETTTKTSAADSPESQKPPKSKSKAQKKKAKKLREAAATAEAAVDQDSASATSTTQKTAAVPTQKNKAATKDTTQNSTSSEEQALMAVIRGLQTEDGSSKKSKKKAKKLAKKTSSENDDSKDANSGESEPEAEIGDALMTIAEAFEDDDVVAEFAAEKERVADEETEKDKDLFVPGWGSWAGAGIKTSNNLRKRFIKKAQPMVRADNHIGHVIISEKKNTAVEKHMLDKVPYPYKSVKQMNVALEKPIGRDFTSETQFRTNIKPTTVVNKIGHIIQPINENALVDAGKKRKAADIEFETKKKSQQSGNKKRRGKH